MKKSLRFLLASALSFGCAFSAVADDFDYITGEWNFHFFNLMGENVTEDVENDTHGIEENVAYYAELSGSIVKFVPTDEAYDVLVADYDMISGTLTFSKCKVDPDSHWMYNDWQLPFVNEADVAKADDVDKLTFVESITASYDKTSGTLSFEKLEGLAFGKMTDEGRLSYYISACENITGQQKTAEAPAETSPVAGVWYFQFDDHYSASYSTGVQNIATRTYIVGSLVKFEADYGFNYPFTATYDAASGDLTFEKVLVNDTGYARIYQCVYTNADNTDNMADLNYVESISAVYDETEQLYTFPEKSGIAYVSYLYGTEGSDGTTPDYLKAYDINSIARTPQDINLGIAGVSVENAPVRYFNLEGIEISNPSPGAVYIRCQGSDVKKVRL